MKRFEYKVITIATKLALHTKGVEDAAKQFEQELNRLGAEGWQFIQRQDGMFFFMRELP